MKLFQNLSETEKFIKDQPWMNAKNPAQVYKKLLEGAGLKVEKCELREKMRQYYSEPELMGNHIGGCTWP